jgi:predicted O-methyltransferase YrrM
MTSDKMFSELENVKFDFIYIDGDHSYEQVLRDLNNSFKVLKVGGCILVDDYAWIKDTVRRAVNDFYNTHFDTALRLCLDWDYQFAFVKTKHYTVVEDGKITYTD